jgi:hypothetical protein
LSKTVSAREALLKLAEARGPGVKLPTLQQLCARLEVSRTTLERAMVPLERRGLLQRKHGSGIYVCDRIRQKTIGVVFGGDIFSPGFSPFWGLLLEAVCRQAGDRRMRPRPYIDISAGHEGLLGHVQLVEDLDAGRLDGLLLFTPHYEHDEAGELCDHGVPLVVFGGAARDWTVTRSRRRKNHAKPKDNAGAVDRALGRVGRMRAPGTRAQHVHQRRVLGS